MILHFVKISGLPRISKMYHGQCPSKTIVYTKVFWGGGGAKNFQKKQVSGGSGIKKFSKFLMSQIDIDNMFPG